jgi:hypothetical protein
MKYIFIPVVLAVMSFCCHAQTTLSFASARPEVKNPVVISIDYTDETKEGRPRGLRQRNAGRLMTIGGIALGLGGVFVYTDARKGTVYQGGQLTQEPEYEKMSLGANMVIGGIGLMIPGIILWKKGQKKYNRYLEQQSVSMHFRPGSTSLVYSF